MIDLAHVDMTELSQAYAFLGNSLLKPMTMTLDIGLDPAFWQEFPNFGSEEVKRAKEKLSTWAESHTSYDREQLIEDISYQFTKLFIGPPSPAAAPWETIYKGDDGQEVTVGFGSATFQMRELLRGIGMEMSNENNQYEDHIGIELLYLSELCNRVDGGASSVEDVESFIDVHPRSWIDSLQAKADAEFPNGYYSLLLTLASSLL